MKKVARQILERLKKLLVIDWRKTRRSRASVKVGIEDLLDDGLPRAYSKNSYEQKLLRGVRALYENYPQRDLNIYY